MPGKKPSLASSLAVRPCQARDGACSVHCASCRAGLTGECTLFTNSCRQNFTGRSSSSAPTNTRITHSLPSTRRPEVSPFDARLGYGLYSPIFVALVGWLFEGNATIAMAVPTRRTAPLSAFAPPPALLACSLTASSCPSAMSRGHHRRASSCRRMPTATAYITDDMRPVRRVSRAVVWFRDGDLRLVDHPGLDAATAHTSSALAPLVVCTPFTSENTLRAVHRLRSALIVRGSTLFVRYADVEEDAVIDFLTEFGAERVHVRMDVEDEAIRKIEKVERAVDSFASVHTWVADLREWDHIPAWQFQSLPQEWPSFLKWDIRANAPIPQSEADCEPQRILPPPGTREPDEVLAKVLDSVRAAATTTSSWRDTFTHRQQFEDSFANVQQLPGDHDDDFDWADSLLLAVLRSAEDYQSPDLAKSLVEIFRQGALSPRRMREIILNFEVQNGRLFRPLFRDAAKTLLDALDAREFHTLLARRDIERRATVDGVHPACFWRWNGFLLRYIAEGVAREGEPPLLLVHGFGASCMHWGKSVSLLKNRYRVFAIDLLGFGRAEKPPMIYTPAVWESVIWDFVREVVREPVFVVGNSIGGYFSCAFGVDAYPNLCAGIGLVNTAGSLQDRSPELVANPTDNAGVVKGALRKWRWLRLIAARFTLARLQGRVGETLKRVYPTNPVPEDGLLEREIRRASLDYGAADVLASGLIGPTPRALSELLGQYDGPLLVFTGILDPLGDVKGRSKRLSEAYPDAKVVTVEAGHCPHDELPDDFVEAVSEWMEGVNHSSDRTTEGTLAEREAVLNSNEK